MFQKLPFQDGSKIATKCMHIFVRACVRACISERALVEFWRNLILRVGYSKRVHGYPPASGGSSGALKSSLFPSPLFVPSNPCCYTLEETAKPDECRAYPETEKLTQPFACPLPYEETRRFNAVKRREAMRVNAFS